MGAEAGRLVDDGACFRTGLTGDLRVAGSAPFLIKYFIMLFFLLDAAIFNGVRPALLTALTLEPAAINNEADLISPSPAEICRGMFPFASFLLG